MIISLERQFTIVGQKDVGAEKKKKKKSVQNLCVLFLDRSSGPSTPPSPGLAPGQWFEEFLWFLWPCKFPLQEMWHEPTRARIRRKELWFLCDQTLWLAVVSGHMTYWTSCSVLRRPTHWWSRCILQPRHQHCMSSWSFICQGEDVPQHPPPTNSLICPPLPPMVAASSLMPTRPALGPLSHGERDNASILRSNLNM